MGGFKFLGDDRGRLLPVNRLFSVVLFIPKTLQSLPGAPVARS